MTSLMLWALPEPPPASEGAVALWQQFLPDGAPEGLYSLPQEVHHDRDRLRAAYLAWLHEVGQRPRRGRSLRDRLQIRPGLSYWWMTIPADFSLEPDSPAYRAVRLMAFAALADLLDAREISVSTRDGWLARAVVDWGEATNRRVTVVRRAPRDDARLSTGARGLRQAAYRAVPPLAAVRVIASTIRLPRRGGRPQRQGTPGGITFIDYLAHLGPTAGLTGEFDSKYWGPLVPLLDELDEPISWLHISGDFATPAVVTADQQVVAAFNRGSTRQVHDLLHSHLTWGVVARSLRDYARIAGIGLRAGRRQWLFQDTSTGVSLWPAFRATYRDQFFGRTAMLNALWINLLDAAVVALPYQRLGVYLFENQPWEMAYVHAWRRSGHGALVGVLHSTALFWSTRLFKDPRDTWAAEGVHPMPWPDCVAVNGPLMRSTCEGGGYPLDRLVDVEALRYFDLLQDPTGEPTGRANRIVVFGEYSRDATERILDLVSAVLERHDAPVVATFRPHPAFVGLPLSLPAGITLDEQPSVTRALQLADVTVCGALSSVAVESACLGRRTLLIGDPALPLTSPADGMAGVMFIASELELSVALASEGDRVRDVVPPPKTFELERSLRSWNTLLARHCD